MRRRKFSHPRRSERQATPFATPAEAWFWGMQCFAARADGARFRADQAETARPCEPDDLLIALEQLVRARRLTAEHVRTLFRFGRRLAPPDSRCRAEARAAHVWDEALDRLATAWRRKGIVA